MRKSWSIKELRFIKLNRKLSLEELSKKLGRTETAIKVRRSILGLRNRVSKWSLKEARNKNTRILNLRRRNAFTTEVLISCPEASVSCSALVPRWVQIRHAFMKNGKCRNCAQSKGGSITADGYRRTRVDGKTVLEHRYVMEKILNRKLFEGETVHHGPGGRSDNSTKNLELRAPGKHKQGWSILEMRRYLLTVPKRLGGLK